MNRYVKLNNGESIPVLGLGMWEAEEPLIGNAITSAVIESGYRHIDCASIYENERAVGKALESVIGTLVKRDDLFITSKLWCTDHKAADVERACRSSLSDLHLDYLDLYLMHFGIAIQRRGDDLEPLGKDGKILVDAISIQETWQAMEKLVKKGLVKSIGVANFTTTMLVDLLTYAKVKPVMNQIELHPYNTQEQLVEFCKYKDIAVTAYSPLGRYGVKDVKGTKLFDEPIIKKLAAKYGKTPAQIVLSWGIARGTIVIPKSTNRNRIAENSNVFDFKLTKEERANIDSLNRNHRFVNPMDWWGIPYFA